MPKKYFIEEERAREARLQGKTLEPESKFAGLLHRAKKIISPQQESAAKQIVAAHAANKYGLILTPNEFRAQYGYPTISDEPQSVYTKIALDTALENARIGAEQESLRSQDMYETALRAMRQYGCLRKETD
jgi:hypothetical protein